MVQGVVPMGQGKEEKRKKQDFGTKLGIELAKKFKLKRHNSPGLCWTAEKTEQLCSGHAEPQRSLRIPCKG